MARIQKRSWRRKLACIMAAVMVVSAIPMSVNAETESELKSQLAELQQQKANIDAQISDLGDDINAEEAKYNQYLDALSNVRAQINVLQQQIDELNTKIDAKNKEIDSKNKEIETKNKEIAAKNNEIAQKQLEHEKTNEKFKQRLDAMYMSAGDSNMLNVLFGAETFAEFLTQTEVLKSISDNDKALMQELQDQKAELEDLKSELETSKADLEKAKGELEKAKSELETQKSEVDKVKSQEQSKATELNTLQEQSKQLLASMEAQRADLQQDADDTEASENAIWALIQQAEQERLAREEEERRRQEQEAAANAGNGGGSGDSTGGSSSGGSSSGGGSSVPSTPNSSGWTWPVPGYSYLSQSYHSGHTGIDIAAGEGTPIVAAQSGYVVFSGFGDGSNGFNRYGNVILISHNNGYYTLYAHCVARYVTTGDTVYQGQTIAGVGNTGYSFGNHLHFEVRNGVQGSRLNPLNFVSEP